MTTVALLCAGFQRMKGDLEFGLLFVVSFDPLDRQLSLLIKHFAPAGNTHCRRIRQRVSDYMSLPTRGNTDNRRERMTTVALLCADFQRMKGDLEFGFLFVVSFDSLDRQLSLLSKHFAPAANDAEEGSQLARWVVLQWSTQ